ncbi:MAG: chemotaxis protein CheW [Clostridia bacterium]|nr:chemotaxis protein CheW [Clostridia bacterium]MDD4666229.1 chemotaxis protein CheW [Clostridia bacterium]
MEEQISQFIVFKLGQEEYGVNILKVQEIVRPLKTTKLPQSPDYVVGIVNLREEIMPIIDLKRFLNLGSLEETEETRIIVMKQNEQVLGILVDEVWEVLRISKKKIKKSDAFEHRLKNEFISGIAKVKGRLIILLDLPSGKIGDGS